MTPSPVWLVGRGLCRVASTMAFDLKVRGRRHVPQEGGALIVSNHQSFLDPILLGVHLRRPISYMAKSELFIHPLFGRMIRDLNAFPVRQGKGDKAAIDETIRRLREGHLLNVFPEGSRSEDGELQPIQRGAALVIRRAQVPVVPAAIEGSFDAWPRHRRFPRPAPTDVLFGPPIQLHHLRPDEIGEAIGRTLTEMFQQLRAIRVAEGRYFQKARRVKK